MRQSRLIVIIRLSVHQEDITALIYMYPTLGSCNSNMSRTRWRSITIIVMDIDTLLSTTDRSFAQKINKEIEDLAHTMRKKLSC
jgi:hypothetical protein